MGRRWQHQVSAEWLLARKDVLTATEIKGLIPEMKRIKKKKRKTKKRKEKKKKMKNL